MPPGSTSRHRQIRGSRTLAQGVLSWTLRICRCLVFPHHPRRPSAAAAAFSFGFDAARWRWPAASRIVAGLAAIAISARSHAAPSLARRTLLSPPRKATYLNQGWAETSGVNVTAVATVPVSQIYCGQPTARSGEVLGWRLRLLSLRDNQNNGQSA